MQLSCLESMCADVIIKPCLLGEYRRSFHARFSLEMIQWLLTYSESTHCPNKHSSRGGNFFFSSSFSAASALCVMSSLNFPLLENKLARAARCSGFTSCPEDSQVECPEHNVKLHYSAVESQKSPGSRPAPSAGDINTCFATIGGGVTHPVFLAS